MRQEPAIPAHRKYRRTTAMMIEFEDHCEKNQRALLAYLDREKQEKAAESKSEVDRRDYGLPHGGLTVCWQWLKERFR